MRSQRCCHGANFWADWLPVFIPDQIATTALLGRFITVALRNCYFLGDHLQKPKLSRLTEDAEKSASHAGKKHPQNSVPLLEIL